MRTLLFGAAALALGACSVLTVDVDVYKGPLINERSLRIQQLTGMVMGAKPLLVELRDTLELARRKVVDHGDHPPLNSDYARPDGHHFHDPVANQVNAILGLYKDLDGSRLWQAIDAVDAAQEELESSLLSYREPSSVHAVDLRTRVLDLQGVVERSPGLTEDQKLEIRERADAVSRHAPERVPFGWSSDFEKLNEEAKSLVAYVSEAAFGFDRGRLVKGLESLIEATLEGPGTTTTQRTKKEQQLFDALVRFAQKMLIMANFEVFLDSRVASALDVFGGPGASSQLFQAIGNSIITIVNDLRAEADHDTRMMDRARDTKNAAVSVFDGAEKQALSGMSPPKDPKEVLDVLLTTLELRRASELAKGNVLFVARLDAARASLRRYRASLIRLRPAVEYLRSSYPATSVQDGSSVTWSNLLDEQLERTRPFRSIWSYLLNEDQRRLEVDRQSWQTVNQIRVAGAGSTNHAIVKDDIGNWYVKRFESDVSELVEGARSVFSAAIDRGDPIEIRGLGRQIDAAETQHRRALAALWTEVDRGSRDLERRLRVVIEAASALPEIRGLLGELDLVGSPGPGSDVSPAALLTALHRRLERVQSARGRASRLLNASSAAREERTRAFAAVDGILRAFLNEHLETARAALRRQRESLTVLGAATAP